ncbi:MAG: carbamoyl-phosphate synthase large subunit, partial [Pseudomonadales bacterium]|nr:carbamoyl-phosphate synthase large subunit [Pseudomonadales bacterium]
MTQETASVDQLYLIAENLAQDFSLFPRKESASVLKGVLTERQIEMRLEQLRNMDVDSYIAETVEPVEAASRPGARQVVRSMGVKIVREIENGPFYGAELEMDFYGQTRKIGLIAQDRTYANGVWGPEHHSQASAVVSEFAIRSMPIVTFMDTPGADGGEHANANNQAHTISSLIAELCNVDVPTIGIIIGQGYSGGAIPLAATNLLLSTRTSVFNTIHPRGLASLVRRYNLSWQECAKFVGVSPYELYKQGYVDGIIDYDPGEDETLENLKDVIVSGILFIEESTRTFVGEHEEIFDHYRRNINRYLNLSESLAAIHASSTLKLRTSPTEYPNLFGTAFRYQRYLWLRRRIKTTT